jgi:hypothetical protein
LAPAPCSRVGLDADSSEITNDNEAPLVSLKLFYQLATVTTLGLATNALAMPTTVTSLDTAGADVLNVPTNVDELGTTVFPANETILAGTAGIVFGPACPSTAGPGPHYIMNITNLTGQSLKDVWYVADPQTTITNVDGLVNGLPAFKIDKNPGDLNNPLTFENQISDGIWAPGELWQIILDDYSNSFGLFPHLINQIGVPSGGPNGSTGNIIAVPMVPEPTAVALLTIGAAVLLARRPKR